MGNLTSQFFANVYLNELDQYVKHKLKIKYYIRYVDDFVILHKQKKILENYKEKINKFLKEQLSLELHPTKSRIRRLKQGTNFLGYRVFFYHKLLRKKNKRKVERKLQEYKKQYQKGTIVFDKFEASLQGWYGYAKQANTFKYRKMLKNSFEEDCIVEPRINKILEKIIVKKRKL